MKTLVLYLKLIGIRLLQGLRLLVIGALGVCGTVACVRTVIGYVESRTFPPVINILLVIFSVFGIIVLSTLKKAIESLVTETNYRIERQRDLKRHKTDLKYQNAHIELENAAKREEENEIMPTRVFKVEKINKAINLNNLVGLGAVKDQLERIRATLEYEKQHGGIKHKAVYHSRFIGNPGTGKTTVAKAYAAMLYEVGVIEKPKYIAVNGNDLMGAYVGQTAPTINNLFKQAAGGVIFIDEAYAVAMAAKTSEDSGYGQEAVNQLLTHLENGDKKTVVIFGGYKDKMDMFFDMNPGLRSRVPINVEFQDYEPEELLKILEMNLRQYGHTLEKTTHPVLLKLFADKIRWCKEQNIPFSNGRFSRNVGDFIHQEHAFNYSKDKSIGSVISISDINVEKLQNLD